MNFDYYIHFNATPNANPQALLQNSIKPNNATVVNVTNNQVHFSVQIPSAPSSMRLQLKEEAVKHLIKWFKTNFTGNLIYISSSDIN